MPDESSSGIPYGKIAAIVGPIIASTVIALYGKLHLNDVAKLDAATAQQSIQMEHALKHWGEECPLIADSADHQAQMRLCPSDECVHARVVRAGSVVAFFLVKGAPLPPELAAMGAPEPMEGVAFAQGVCLDWSAHGPPNHPEAPYEYGAERPDGWLLVTFRWADGCVGARWFHRPTQSWSAEWRFTFCAH